jgi:hypothetical protein
MVYPKLAQAVTWDEKLKLPFSARVPDPDPEMATGPHAGSERLKPPSVMQAIQVGSAPPGAGLCETVQPVP